MKNATILLASLVVLSGCITSPVASKHYGTRYHVAADSYIYACRLSTSNLQNLVTGAEDAECLGRGEPLKGLTVHRMVPAGTRFRVIRIMNYRNIDAFPVLALIELELEGSPRAYLDWELRERYVQEFTP